MRYILITISCLVFFSCGMFDSEEEATIDFHVVKDSTFSDEVISIVIKDNFTEWNAEGKLNANAPVGSYAWTSLKYSTANLGEISVKFELKTKTNAIISKGEVTIPSKNDWAWSIDFWHSKFDPLNGCFGCVDSKSFPILNSDFSVGLGDSIFVVWSGNYISNPVIY